MPAALALELTHSFTLIHDDIMDGDAFRRGVPTVHTKWDEPTAILAGDVLYARAFDFICISLASDNAKVRAISMLAEACVEICKGQHMDMSFEKRNDVNEGEYLEMVSKKTGALYAACCGDREHPCRWPCSQDPCIVPLWLLHGHGIPDPG